MRLLDRHQDRYTATPDAVRYLTESSADSLHALVSTIWRYWEDLTELDERLASREAPIRLSDQEITALAQACGDAPVLLAESWATRREVVEIGAGHGRFATALGAVSSEVWGLAVPSPGDGRIRWRQLDVTDVDSWPPGEFDGVVLADVAALVPRDKASAMIRSAVARLAPGGIIAVATPVTALMALGLTLRHPGAWAPSADELEAELSSAGLTTEVLRAGETAVVVGL